MWVIAILFIGAVLLFYPVTLRIATDGVWWLPRVCGGYASARRLRRKKRARSGRGRGMLLRLLRLLPALRLHRWQLCCGGGQRQGECIISLRLWDIIRISLRRLRRKIRRRQNVRRA